MRIIMLPKLILDEESEEICLKNCNLVVDGHSFFYNAYEESKIPYVFGCDAKEFARYLRVNKLLKFKRANVKCFFVFKGGDNDIKAKIQKIETTKFDFGPNFKFVPPIFMREVCLRMLDESGVEYATCVTENTDDCVALAEALNCPVVSSNIEYCFKKVPYIPATTLKYTHPDKYITCKQYKLQDFLKKYSLTERNIAIFVTLSDVNIFKQNYFDDLLKTWNVCDEKLYNQNKKLLKWLSEHDEDKTLSDISNFINDENENKKFTYHIQKFMDKMHNKEWNLATNYLYNSYRIPMMAPDVWWFEKGILSQNIAIPYINLYRHKFIQGSTAIEKKNSTDSIMPAIDIIVYAYNLLTNFQKATISVYQDAENIIQINTEDFNVSKPSYSCLESVLENGWAAVRHLKLLQHFLRENNLHLESLFRIPPQARIMVITMAYFSLKKLSAGIDVTKEIYCFIIQICVSHNLGLLSYLNQVHPLSDKVINQDEWDNLIQVNEKYSKLNEHEEIEIFDAGKLNTLVEIQYCLLHMNYLNLLCGTEYDTTRYDRYINGPFMYKLFLDMENCNNFNVFVEELFHSAPNTLNYINLYISQYENLIDSETAIDS